MIAGHARCSPRQTIKAKARELGFDLCGIAPADGYPELAFLPSGSTRGYAGEMAYLRASRRRARRRPPRPALGAHR